MNEVSHGPSACSAQVMVKYTINICVDFHLPRTELPFSVHNRLEVIFNDLSDSFPLISSTPNFQYVMCHPPI